MGWTDSQREAIDTRGRRVIVSAGAGSGKTRVLVERFLSLLEENPAWRVPDIVAVTFTEKAAREMVSRIRREIRLRIHRSASAQERGRWRDHRNSLDSARIGTIHSLCSYILRAHSAEAGLDPAFKVLDEAEAASLLEQAIAEALDGAAQSAKDPLSGSEVELFGYLSPHEIGSLLRSLIAQGERASRAVSRLHGLDEQGIVAYWSAALTEAKLDSARALLERDAWRSDAEVVRRVKAGDPSDRREQCRARVADLLDAASSSEGESRVRALLEIEESINLKGGSKNKWPSEEAFKEVAAALARLRQAVRDERTLALEMNTSDLLAAPATRLLARLYGRARKSFAAIKRDRAALDFNDLEELTERMLASHPEVRKRHTDAAIGSVRALMVDEFQDTSPLQKSILEMIAPRSQEFFIIGDAKQSIYRFRGADVTVFQVARKQFEAAGGREVGLSLCFRTHRRLVDFINHLFPAVFARESLYDTDYEPMQAARESYGAIPPVELHIITEEKHSEARSNVGRLRELEAALLARRIKRVVEEGELPVCDEQGGETRRAGYGDFALLFQASTSFDIYEQALADQSLPYVTVAGRGFYDRQEITDLSNLLAFLANPTDSLRLAAALRSPMFGLSDETLFRLALSRRPLWQGLCDRSVEVPGEEAAVRDFARDRLLSLRSLAGRMSAWELVTTAVSETGYLATLMALPHGERRVANVEKFIEQAHGLSSITLSELVERTSELKLKEAREGEATVEEAGAVRIMTAHKSKGLEFPIVVIADAAYTGGRDSSIVAAHPELGICLDVRADESHSKDEPARPAYFEMMRIVEERMDRAEKKRLLYVAATRARDRLIISAAPGRSKLSGDHWLGRITRALGIEEDKRPSSIAYPGGRVDLFWHDADEVAGSMNESRTHSGIESVWEHYETAKPVTDHGAETADISESFPLIRPLNSP